MLLRDLRDERSSTVPFPPGETRFSMARTRRFAEEPLPMLLESYERFGPVFTLRLFHGNVVFMLGPAANHYITVSHAANFTWREGHFRDLIGLMGDGLLTIDGEFHRRSRLIMLPAFHHDHITASVDLMVEETNRALDRFTPGTQIDLYAWTRRLALRVAMRALFGLDPDGERARAIDAAGLFERALSFYSSDYVLRVLRAPYTPWARMQQAARELDTLIYSEISHRRNTGERGEDILSLLLDAHDEDGTKLTDLQIRDEVMTLMFAGHDTTTSTVSFMFYELARSPDIAERLIAEQDVQLKDGQPTAAQLTSGELTELELVLEETLAQVPARLGRTAALDRAVRVRRPHRPRASIRQLLLLGQPPPARRVRRPRGVPPGPFHARGPCRSAQGRLRPLRRRLAHVHRHALRPARGPYDRHDHPLALHALTRRRLPDEHPPDAHHQPQGGPAHGRPPSCHRGPGRSLSGSLKTPAPGHPALNGLRPGDDPQRRLAPIVSR